MIYTGKINIPKNRAEKIEYLLFHEPKNENECFGEDETITYTCKFDKPGVEMDIKMCGVNYEEGSSNLPWTEAVLFINGGEVGCTEICDNFFGNWEIEHDGNVYRCTVRKEMQL